jgi:gliding motility-associated-like protein
MRHTLLFLFLLVSISAKAQYTSIPDINFEKALIDQGIDSGLPDGKVLTSNINTINSLFLEGRNISDLTGIQGFVNLNNLDCSYNYLTTLDLSKNIKLLSINCRYNKLTNLDLSSNPELNDITCYYNELTNINFSGNPKLSYVSCENNLLTNLDFSGNPILNNLYCYDNKLKDINLLGCPKIVQVECSNNQLIKLDFSNNPELISLSCDKNQLTNLDFSNNTKLNYINCNQNQLSSLDVSKNINLLSLYCTNNQIKYLNLSFPNFSLFRTGSWINNPDLKCINVLDVNYFNSHFLTLKDAIANYFDSTGPKFESTTQTICSKQNPTLNDIVATGYNIKWFDSLIGGNELPSTTSLVEGKTYYAMNTAGSCESSRTLITVTLQPISVPLGTSPQSLCNVKNPTLNNLNVSGTSIQWYDIAIGGNLLSSSTQLINGTTYYASQTLNGCESARIPILVNLINSIEPTSTSPQTFCLQQNATISSIAITGQNLKWYDALTNGNLVTNTSLLQNGITYYASQTINGCESERTPILINIQNTLAPTGDSNQSFCTVQNPTIANLIVTGNAIKWYDSVNNGSLLPQTTNLVNGKTYYASQTTTTCESERFGVSISIVNTPPAPTANANQSFCKKENATLNAIQISGQNLKWYDTNAAVATLPNTTLLENNKTYYASQTIGCESARTAILVQVYDTPLPTGSTNQQFCVDENATLSKFNISGSNIKWYDELTNGTILAETTLLQNGKTYYATQTLNNCESESVAIVAKIQDTPIPIANSPQLFCVQKLAKISNIAIVGQNITWFENATTSINLSDSTVLENGITYYASQSISNCESDRIPISITILPATTGDCINFVDELPYLKFFTPNNDGYNDYWTIDFAYLKANTGIRIFDRYGKLIKTLTSNSNKWNGTFNGTELPSTDYWFVVTRANGQEYKGHFSLKR